MEYRPQPAHRQPSGTAASTRTSTPTAYRPVGTDLRGGPPGPQAGAAGFAPRSLRRERPRQKRSLTTQRGTSVTSLPSPSQQPVPGVSAGFCPLRSLTGPDRRTSGGVGRLALPQARPGRSPPWPGVFVGCVCGSAAESQVMGRRSSGWRRRARGAKSWPIGIPRKTATGGDGRTGWSGPAPAGCVPGVDVRGDPVEVWLVQAGLDELPRCALGTEPLAEDQLQRRFRPGVVRPVFVAVGTGGSAAREARPVSTGVELHGECTAIAGLRREPACGE